MSNQAVIDGRLNCSKAGCKATSRIPAGAELIIEYPWFTCPTNSQPEDIVNKLREARQQNPARVVPLWNALSPPVPLPPDNSHGAIEAQTYLNIFKDHSLPCGTGPWKNKDVAMSGLFYHGDLLHRSCDPNVHGQWIWGKGQAGPIGKMIFRSLRPIEIGEYLSVSPDVRGILYSRAVRHQRFTAKCLRQCYCQDLPQPEQKLSDGRRSHIGRVVSQVCGESEPEDTMNLIPNIETALRCLDEERIYQYRDTLWYALYRANSSNTPGNNAMLFKHLEYAWYWAMVFVGPSDERVIPLKKELDTLRASILSASTGTGQ